MDPRKFAMQDNTDQQCHPYHGSLDSQRNCTQLRDILISLALPAPLLGVAQASGGAIPAAISVPPPVLVPASPPALAVLHQLVLSSLALLTCHRFTDFITLPVLSQPSDNSRVERGGPLATASEAKNLRDGGKEYRGRETRSALARYRSTEQVPASRSARWREEDGEARGIFGLRPPDQEQGRQRRKQGEGRKQCEGGRERSTSGKAPA